MSKYIIINCPACAMGWNTNYECLNNGLDCKEVTNCLIKQIVEKCYDYELYSSQDLAEEILELLEIQEGEDEN